MKDTVFGLSGDVKPVMRDKHQTVTGAAHRCSLAQSVQDVEDLEFSEFGRDQRVPHGAAVVLLVSVIAATGAAGLLFAAMRWLLS